MNLIEKVSSPREDADVDSASPPLDNNDHNQHRKRKKKRSICARCHRPRPQTCVCSALPTSRVDLHNCEVVVLQHPHESRRKNRSLPLVELCVNDQHLHVTVGRTFQSAAHAQVDATTLQLLQQTNHDDDENNCNVMLIYPSENAVSLTQGLKLIRERQQQQQQQKRPERRAVTDKIVLVFLDATWKYAREMYRATMSNNDLPPNAIHVKLTREDWHLMCCCSTSSDDHDKQQTSVFKPARFEIRTPPSPEHLSTAECMAWVVSAIEDDPSIYDVIMKPLDLMVEQWRSFAGTNGRTFSFSNGDGTMDDATRAQESKPRKRKM